jgi:uncharacterized protein YjbI with pentapeptide repeats
MPLQEIKAQNGEVLFSCEAPTFADAFVVAAADHVELRELDLRHCSFRNKDLSGIQFPRSRISYCDFSNALLHRSVFSFASITFCNFTSAHCNSSSFSGATIASSLFNCAQLIGSGFNEAEICSSLFRDVEFRRADLFGITLDSVELTDSDLTGVKFCWASHELIAEILFQAIHDGNTGDLTRFDCAEFAGAIRVGERFQWCWDMYAGHETWHQPVVQWALDICAKYVLPDTPLDQLPDPLARHVRNLRGIKVEVSGDE